MVGFLKYNNKNPNDIFNLTINNTIPKFKKSILHNGFYIYPTKTPI